MAQKYKSSFPAQWIISSAGTSPMPQHLRCPVGSGDLPAVWPGLPPRVEQHTSYAVPNSSHSSQNKRRSDTSLLHVPDKPSMEGASSNRQSVVASPKTSLEDHEKQKSNASHIDQTVQKRAQEHTSSTRKRLKAMIKLDKRSINHSAETELAPLSSTSLRSFFRSPKEKVSKGWGTLDASKKPATRPNRDQNAGGHKPSANLANDPMPPATVPVSRSSDHVTDVEQWLDTVSISKPPESASAMTMSSFDQRDVPAPFPRPPSLYSPMMYH